MSKYALTFILTKCKPVGSGPKLRKIEIKGLKSKFKIRESKLETFEIT